MPDKSLIDFIVSQKRIGAHIEKIRSDLLTTDWSDADIDAALVYIEARDKKRVLRAKGFKKALVIILGIVLILGGTYITLTLMGKKVPLIPEPKIELIQFPDFEEKVPDPIEEIKTAPVVIDDITLVRNRFETEFKDMKYIRAERDGGNIIISAIATDEFGVQAPKDIVYVKEDGIWNMSIQKSEERAAYLAELASSSVPVIAPLLIVSDIKVRPVPPKVNNKDTEIHVFIQNSGLGTTTGETVVMVQYDTREPAKITYKKPIGPNEIVTIVYKLYPVGKKYTDTAGMHTVTAILENQEQKTQEFDLY